MSRQFNSARGHHLACLDQLYWRPSLQPTAASPFLRPSGAFIGASWAALLIGTLAFLIGLWNNSSMQLNEKGYYFTVLMFGLFAAISLQKTVRDRAEGIPVTGIYAGVCWVGLGMALLLLVVGLWNASFTASEKGFFAMSYVLALFSVVAVQKNVRDLKQLDAQEPAAFEPDNSRISE